MLWKTAVPLVLGTTITAACSGTGGSGGPSSGSAGAAGGSGGSGGGGGSAGSGGSGFDAAAGGASGSAACAYDSFEGKQVPLDMFIMMDQSGSMAQDDGNGTRWNAVTGALETFLDSPESAGMGAGIGYFPHLLACSVGVPGCNCPFNVCEQDFVASCNTNDYSTPDVAIQPLPGVATSIKTSLAAHTPDGGTPTFPALQGAMQIALKHAVAVPDHNTIVVLATDGSPTECEQDVDKIAALATAGLNNNPVIRTFVIGIGNIANMDNIARSGGTGFALLVDTATAGQDFLSAMTQIRTSALACDFRIPEPAAGEELDIKKVNVRYTPPGTQQGDLVYKVEGAAYCDDASGGWYYDNTDAPKNIKLCPATCAEVSQAVGGKVEIELGCKTEEIPR